jgi:hypothetical protein
LDKVQKHYFHSYVDHLLPEDPMLLQVAELGRVCIEKADIEALLLEVIEIG